MLKIPVYRYLPVFWWRYIGIRYLRYRSTLWLRPIWSVNVFFMHSASAVDIYRAQRKHINYSIWPMRISRHDLRRRYSNSFVIDAGSQFGLRACSQASTYIDQWTEKCDTRWKHSHHAPLVFQSSCSDWVYRELVSARHTSERNTN
jgi:hypothetical protein